MLLRNSLLEIQRIQTQRLLAVIPLPKPFPQIQSIVFVWLQQYCKADSMLVEESTMEARKRLRVRAQGLEFSDHTTASFWLFLSFLFDLEQVFLYRFGERGVSLLLWIFTSWMWIWARLVYILPQPSTFFPRRWRHSDLDCMRTWDSERSAVRRTQLQGMSDFSFL